MSSVLSYDARTITLHWITAALIVGLWILGQTIDDFSKGDPRVFARSLHITFGALLGLVLLLRIHRRLRGGTQLPPVGASALDRIATLTHRLLYVLLIGTVLLGLTNVWVRGDTLFHLFRVPAFDPASPTLRK